MPSLCFIFRLGANVLFAWRRLWTKGFPTVDKAPAGGLKQANFAMNFPTDLKTLMKALKQKSDCNDIHLLGIISI